MGKFVYAAAAQVAAGHGQAPATKIRPDNAPCGCNNATATPQANTSQTTWINGGYLYVNGRNYTTFNYNSSQERPVGVR